MRLLSVACSTFLTILTLACGKSDPTPPFEAESADPSTRSESAAKAADCIPEWETVSAGAEYRTLNCQGGGPPLHLMRVDPKRVPIEAIVTSGQTAAEVARAGRKLFAINANFFDQDIKPLGVVRSAGRDLNPLHPVSWQSIFVVTRSGEASIVTVDKWAALEKTAATAVQAGPRLVIDGQENRVKPATRSFRSGVCIDTAKRVVFFATLPEQPLDVHEVRTLTHKPESSGGLGCRQAMLFDGGPSTQFFVERKQGDIVIDGDPRDPVFVVAGSL